MGRLPTTDTQSLKTRFYYAAIKSNCALNDAQKEMQFCDPLLKKPYEDRRRIFNRMKMGIMPYRGTKRDEFIARVAAYDGLEFTADLYYSEFWNLIDQPFSGKKNNLLILKCFNCLCIASSKVSTSTETSLDDLVEDSLDFDPFKSTAPNIFESKPADLIDYENTLQALLSNYPFSLDFVALLAALFRNALVRGEVEVARILRRNYLIQLELICNHYQVEMALMHELIMISKDNILKLGDSSNSFYTERLYFFSKIMSGPTDELLKFFLSFHEEI